MVIADRGYDADSVRSCMRDQGAIPNIDRANRKKKYPVEEELSIANATMSSASSTS